MMARILPMALQFQDEVLAQLGAEADPFRHALTTLLKETP